MTEFGHNVWSGPGVYIDGWQQAIHFGTRAWHG